MKFGQRFRKKHLTGIITDRLLLLSLEVIIIIFLFTNDTLMSGWLELLLLLLVNMVMIPITGNGQGIQAISASSVFIQHLMENQRHTHLTTFLTNQNTGSLFQLKSLIKMILL